MGVDDVGIREWVTCTGQAAVITGDGQMVGAGEIEGAVMDQIVSRTKYGIDLAHASDA